MLKSKKKKPSIKRGSDSEGSNNGSSVEEIDHDGACSDDSGYVDKESDAENKNKDLDVQSDLGSSLLEDEDENENQTEGAANQTSKNDHQTQKELKNTVQSLKKGFEQDLQRGGKRATEDFKNLAGPNADVDSDDGSSYASCFDDSEDEPLTTSGKRQAPAGAMAGFNDGGYKK